MHRLTAKPAIPDLDAIEAARGTLPLDADRDSQLDRLHTAVVEYEQQAAAATILRLRRQAVTRLKRPVPGRSSSRTLMGFEFHTQNFATVDLDLWHE